MASTRAFLMAVWLLGHTAGCDVFEARSGDLECSLATDCTAPRVCEMGYCVIPSTVIDAEPFEIDADPDRPDAQVLPDADPNRPDASGCDQGPSIDFSDNFDDNSLDPRWTVSVAGTGAVAEVNGQVEFSYGAGQPNHSAKIQTANPRFDISGRRVFVEVPLVMTGEGHTRIRLLSDSTHFAAMRVTSSGELLARLNTGSGIDNLNTVVYNATQQRWWQIREADSMLHYEVSADGMSWNTIATAATPSFANDIQVQLQGISTANNGSSGDVHFDNLNELPICP